MFNSNNGYSLADIALLQVVMSVTTAEFGMTEELGGL